MAWLQILPTTSWLEMAKTRYTWPPSPLQNQASASNAFGSPAQFSAYPKWTGTFRSSWHNRRNRKYGYLWRSRRNHAFEVLRRQRYSRERSRNRLSYNGATGPGIGCWMVFGTRESSSGGPFFRDIENQSGDDQEIYNYMNSGHNQTESYRLNVLHGPYALVFTEARHQRCHSISPG